MPIFCQAPYFFLVGQMADQFVLKFLKKARLLGLLENKAIARPSMHGESDKPLQIGLFQVQKQLLLPHFSKSHSP